MIPGRSNATTGTKKERVNSGSGGGRDRKESENSVTGSSGGNKSKRGNKDSGRSLK